MRGGRARWSIESEGRADGARVYQQQNRIRNVCGHNVSRSSYDGSAVLVQQASVIHGNIFLTFLYCASSADCKWNASCFASSQTMWTFICSKRGPGLCSSSGADGLVPPQPSQQGWMEDWRSE